MEYYIFEYAPEGLYAHYNKDDIYILTAGAAYKKYGNLFSVFLLPQNPPAL